MASTFSTKYSKKVCSSNLYQNYYLPYDLQTKKKEAL